jgi:hypothetical protein
MTESSDTVLERARVREVTGVFRSPAALEETVEALLLSGFERADIDRLPGLDEVPKRLGNVYVAPEELADVSRAPRRPFFSRDDVTLTVAVVAGTLACSGALGGVFAVVSSGGESVPAILAAALAGAACGGIGTLLAARLLGEVPWKSNEDYADAGGVVLWVRVRSPDQEERALRVLREHGARAVRVHEIPIEKRTDDIPLSSLRPDPWLGDERLGHP